MRQYGRVLSVHLPVFVFVEVRQYGGVPIQYAANINTSDWDQFSSDLMTYSKDNLLQLTAYIAKPFTTLYTTDVIITPITMVANMGGLLGLCMGFSVVSLAEIIHLVVTAIAARVNKN